MEPGSNPLLTDLYQLNMIEAYLACGETKTAVFELFVRRLPARRGFLMAAGLEQALKFLEDLPQRKSPGSETPAGSVHARLLIFPIYASRATSMPCRRGPSSLPTSRFSGLRPRYQRPNLLKHGSSTSYILNR